MFVPQSGPSRHNIHRERIVPEDVESQPAEPCQIERLARYLKRERQWGQVFTYGKPVEEVTTFIDSDWAVADESGIHVRSSLGGSNWHVELLNEEPATEEKPCQECFPAEGRQVSRHCTSKANRFGTPCWASRMCSSATMARPNFSKCADAALGTKMYIMLNPSVVKTWHRQAQALIRLGHCDEAVKSAMRGAELDLPPATGRFLC